MQESVGSRCSTDALLWVAKIQLLPKLHYLSISTAPERALPTSNRP